MEGDSSHWKALIQQRFYEESTSKIAMPSKREGTKPTKNFNPKEYLKACILENNEKKVSGQIQLDKIQTLPAIINQTLGPIMKNLKAEGPIPISKQSNKYPYSSVGMVVSQKQINGKFFQVFGSGCIIGPQLVLTCAHNIYNCRSGKHYHNIRFIPAPIVLQIKSGEYAGKGFKVKEVIFPAQYQNMDPRIPDSINNGHIFDYAVLKIQTDLNLQEYFGSFSYDFDWQKKPSLENKTILEGLQLIGYPSIRYKPQFSLFKCSSVADTNFMLYTIETLPGSSGSPILQDSQNGVLKVIAIHVLDASDFTTAQSITKKAALKLRSDMLQHLKRIQHRYYLDQKNITAENVPQIVKQITARENNHTMGIELALHLYNNNIGAEGCYHLCQAQWQQLITLNLDRNNVGEMGCKHISESHWKQLAYFYLNKNGIGAEGCKYLCLAKWEHLTFLSLKDNNIGPKGCSYLSQSNWEKLLTFNLEKNMIGDEGCQYLSQTNWKQLTTAHLDDNCIGAEGCKFLSQADWPRLQSLSLDDNEVDAAGCAHLSKAQSWKNSLRTLWLQRNKIAELEGRNIFQQCSSWQIYL